MRKITSFAAMLIAGLATAAVGEEERTRKAMLAIGSEEESCAACHGADASGRGELADKLVKPPKDLTRLAEQNGGTFPFWRVFDIIAGDTTVEGHDTSQMPLFSQRMRGQEAAGVFPPAPLRVLALTHYLESIQE
jgi:mono/diheme cytochrome c family protein